MDSEANSLTPSKFWCIVLKEYDKNNYKVFVNDDFYTTVNNSLASLLGSREGELIRLSEFKGWIEKEREDVNRLNGQVRIVGHNNIGFDFHWIKAVLGTDLFSYGFDVRDTYVLSRLASPKRKGGHSIKMWGERLGLSKQEIEDSQWSTFDPVMITRCLVDTEIGEGVYKHLRNKELRGFSLSCIELEHEVQKLISEQQRNGIFVDEQLVSDLHSETKRHADYLENEIRKVFPISACVVKEYNPKITKAGVFSRNTCGPIPYEQVGGPYTLINWRPFNIDSPPQRVERLLKIGWVPTSFSKRSGKPTFTEESLSDLPEDAPKEAKLFGEYLMSRSRQRLMEQLLELMDKDGYIHGYIDILGAATHRMASNSPNLQNIPSSEEDKKNGGYLKGLPGKWGWDCRNVFRVKDRTRSILVDTDASGIQLRGLAHYGGSPEYISLVSDPNVDIHKVHADVLGCSRSVAKTFIYAFLMGAGVKKLAFVLGGNDVERGKELLEQFYERFPFLKEFKERLDKDVERGYYIGLDGRLIALDREKPHKAMAVSLQSFEAIIMKRASVLYQNDLKQNEIPFIQRLMVHDEYLAETEIKFKEMVGKAMVNGIIKAGEIYESKCPLDGKAQYGYSWSEVH